MHDEGAVAAKCEIEAGRDLDVVVDVTFIVDGAWKTKSRRPVDEIPDAEVQ